MIADHNVLCLKYFVLNFFFPDIALCREYILESCVHVFNASSRVMETLPYSKAPCR